ncbi:MAG: polysaccharide deacetylase family protein [Parachlamydiaceae bacterium]
MPENISFSIDLDNLWAYLKVKGDPKWEEYPSYFPQFIPPFLDLLDALELKITFFIVGKDASLKENLSFMQEIVKRGHEVANHSFKHEPWLHTYSKEELLIEISQAEEAIALSTGQTPLGFRGPGFVFSEELFRLLKERNYLYDSSLLPSFIGPLARLYYNTIAKNEPNRDKLFGSFKDGFKSNKAHEMDGIFEIPVTTIPYLKTPFHLSYLIYLASYSPAIMKGYLKFAIACCKLDSISPNFLIHPTDFLDDVQVPELSFFPGIKVPHEKKRELFACVIEAFKKPFTPILLSERARKKI